jgi:formylglycine-generating enzyme required for sulfatase activity
MSQCLNPDCLHINLEKAEICQQCGSKLLLVDRYRPLQILGQGGFGRTFLAIDEFKPSKPRCVIKQFLPDVRGKKALAKAAELFEREAMRLDELGRHEQIPELLAFVEREDRQYLIQEFIDGEDLAKELKIKGVFDERQIRELLGDLLTALKFIHEHNVIHRDIKPENIIRRKDGKLVLVDFGAAKERANDNTSTVGTVIGSLAYIAPEQAVGKAQFASDLYSLGATCIHLLTDIEPTELFDVNEGQWIWRDYLADNQVDYELSHVLDKLIETATKKRFQSADEVLEALISKSKLSSPVAPSIALPRSHSVKQQVKTNATSVKRSNTPSPQKLKLKILEFDFVTISNDPCSLVGRKVSLPTHHHLGKAKYITLDLGKNITMDLMGIPGDKFLMGSPENEAERGIDESPQHLVTIRPFLLGKYPITQAQWQAVMGNNPSRFVGGHSGRKPVEKVSWFDCQEFCQRLSELVGRKFRLPTEAEWEYACRGKTTTPFHFGKTITTDFANYNGEHTYGGAREGEYRHQTTEVGSFSPNCFGLYDMHGNVAEWCADVWQDSYNHAPDNENLKAPRVLRGGSWIHLPGCCRSAHRLNSSPNSKSDAFGFRIASSV